MNFFEHFLKGAFAKTTKSQRKNTRKSHEENKVGKKDKLDKKIIKGSQNRTEPSRSFSKPDHVSSNMGWSSWLELFDAPTI